jgi:hypothetical protein
MLNLIFKIDKDYLIYHTLKSIGQKSFSSEKYKKDIIAFQNYAWEKDKFLYDLLIGRFVVKPKDFQEKKYLKLLQRLKDIESYLDFLKKSKYFKKIYEQTKNYLNFCKKEWQRNYLKTIEIMTELTGIDFKKENKKFIVYITHPSLKNGFNGRDGTIAWGHNEDWPNYSVVYLWHEILHSYFELSDLDHALIELLTDNELRVRLNGGKYPPFVGHENLEKLKYKILPYWKKYLKSKNKNIFEFKKLLIGRFLGFRN